MQWQVTETESATLSNVGSLQTMLPTALITPSVLRWARERRDLSQDELAAMVHVKPDQIRQWELGEAARPTINQAYTLANKLRVPVGYLFLDQPPDLESPLPDLRTVDLFRKRDLSIDLREVIHDAKRKQNWYRQHLIQEGSTPLAFVGSFTLQSNRSEVVSSINEYLGMDDFQERNRPPTDKYRKELTERAEAAGVSVLRSSYVRSNTRRKLAVDEFRGFAIVDEIAPLVFINGADAVSAQIFTLIHELAHVWLGVEGISAIDIEESIASEALCNSVAAEVLVPSTEFRGEWVMGRPIERQVPALAKRFSVSELVILRRAQDARKIDRSEFLDYYNHIKGRRSSGGGSGTFYNSLPYRQSRQISTAILSEAMSGSMSFREASRLLGVKASTIRGAAERYGLV